MLGPPWSKSKLEKVWICPWLAHAQYELKLEIKAGLAALFGRAVHALIARELATYIGYQDPEKFIRKAGAEITEEAEELAEKAINNFPIDIDNVKQVEAWYAIDKKGHRSPSNQHDWFRGIEDVVSKVDSTLCIIDHKIGRMQTDHEYERHGSVLRVRAHYPEVKEVTFGRYWVRSGNCDWYHYRWERKGRGKAKLFIDDIEHDPRFLYEYIKQKIEHAESLKPVPTPGEHCENMFGEPCPFLGNECPLNQEGKIIPAGSDIVVLPDDPTKYLMECEPEKRVAVAFRMLLQGLPTDKITPEIADLAKQGIAHVRNGATKVNARLKDVAKDMCFQSGGKWHGMKPKKTVDVEAALSILIGRDTPLKEMAKACSVSATGINKMSVELEDTKQTLFKTYVDDAGGEEFGPIKKVE